MTTPSPRAVAFVGRLRFRGLLSSVRVSGLAHHGHSASLSLTWEVPDTSDSKGTWIREVVVPLREDASEADWAREVLHQLADAAGHEIGEGLWVGGGPPFDPHLRPRVYPWRAQDREHDTPPPILTGPPPPETPEELSPMPLTELQRDTIEAITTIYETGRLPGPEAYGTVTILADGAGLSYGARQATARASSLTAVLQAFVRRGGVLQRGDYALVGASVGYDCLVLDDKARARGCTKPAPAPIVEFARRLAAWGADRRMQDAQEEVFRSRYAEPAEQFCRELGLVLPLSYAVLHDTWIQSSPEVIADLRQRFPESPPSRGGDERAWTKAFLQTRHDWLSNHARLAVRTSAYRTRDLLRLVAEARWMLERPLEIRGVLIR